MSTLALVKFGWKSHPRLLFGIARNLEEMCRSAFVSALVAEGIGPKLRNGSMSLEAIHGELQLEDAHDELEAWLDVGVGLGELSKGADGYRLKGALSKQLSDPANQVWHAFFQTRTDVFFDYIRHTPSKLRKHERFKANEEHGKLIAQSSRTVEPLMLDLVDRVVPKGACRMLEVGCGSGVYLKRACDNNPALQAVGLDLTDNIVAFARDNLRRWGLEDRVVIEKADIRAFDQPGAFDLVTFYSLIYYFPKSERVELLRHLRRQLSPTGQLVLMTLTQARDTSTRTMHLWSSMTEGSGPLPTEQALRAQLVEAGFSKVEGDTLMPNFWVFVAS